MSAGRDTPSRRAVSLWFLFADSNSFLMIVRSNASTRARSGWLGPGSPGASPLEGEIENGAADGFNLIPPALPSSLATFVDEVLPLLRAKSLFREDYSGSTLRDHLGLERPAARRTAILDAAE